MQLVALRGRELLVRCCQLRSKLLGCCAGCRAYLHKGQQNVTTFSLGNCDSSLYRQSRQKSESTQSSATGHSKANSCCRIAPRARELLVRCRQLRSQLLSWCVGVQPFVTESGNMWKVACDPWPSPYMPNHPCAPHFCANSATFVNA
jgi:hypothetical protein